MLEFIHVGKRYRNKVAVEDVSFHINPGDAIGLLGPNGAGKSTTLSMIATLTKPSAGDILFEGKSIIKKPTLIREKMGYVPQDIALYEMITGRDNLLFFGRAYHIEKRELSNRIQVIAGIVGLTQQELKQRVCEYSGGMKRKLNIAVALLNYPKFVILDEPTVGIDIESRNAIIETIRRINQQGITILYTGHYFEEIEYISNRLFVLQNGRLRKEISKKELVESNTSVEAFYLDTVSQGEEQGKKIER